MILGSKAKVLQHEAAVLQRLFDEFPKQTIREISAEKQGILSR